MQKVHPHRIQQNEKSILAISLSDLMPGDIFVRQGTSHILCSPKNGLIREPETPDDTVLICNLTNGSTWWCSMDEEVWPCLDVTLNYRTLRRG